MKYSTRRAKRQLAKLRSDICRAQDILVVLNKPVILNPDVKVIIPVR